jgi:hypothetical protein
VGQHPPMPDKHTDQIASKREQSERINEEMADRKCVS